MAILFIFWAFSGIAQRWEITDPALIGIQGKRDIIPLRFVLFNADYTDIKEILWSAPKESTQPIDASQTIIKIGLADGSVDAFRIVQYDMMETELASSYPEIRTFKGRSTSNPLRTIRADLTSVGFRAVIRDERGMMYIDPFQRNDLEHTIVYFKKDFIRNDQWSCGFSDNQEGITEHQNRRMTGDCMFRSYRLAIATTGSYSNYFGATSSTQSALVLSQVVTVVNRLNEVYEFDLAVRLILIGNTTNIFFYDPNTDPYTNGNSCTQLNQNQTTVNNIIGSANYDVGHVVDLGDNGCAELGCICLNSSKARGATAFDPPVGDPFVIDFVAHELGHQFGGNHTQNNACNRNNSTAMEPGSASTIMGYAGICAPNVQSNSDAYFHGINLQEIANEVQSNSCHLIVSSSNSPPIVANVPNYTIPISTPFVLTATANDPDDDLLTYCWEQFDEEVATMPPVSSSTVGPMFKSITSTASSSRYFYNLPDLANNVNPTWEELPSVARDMEFRVTVRDLYEGMYGCTDEDNMIVTTVASAGPFIVTSQNAGGVWLEGSAQIVTWNVANTTAAPVNCSTVDILLSLDGGYTYPTTILQNEPNDGSATFSVPVGVTIHGRVMVKGSNNIFFDINNSDIVITPGPPNFTISVNPNTISECNDVSIQTSVIVGQYLGYSDPVMLSLLNAPPGAVVNFVPPVVTPGSNSTLTVSNLQSLSGTYTPTIRGTSTTGDKDASLTINLFGAPLSPTLLSPLNNDYNVLLNPLLDWSVISGATQYEYQVASDNEFTSIALSGTAMSDQFQVNSGLGIGNQYFWRVRAQNVCGTGTWSSTFSFITIGCLSTMSTNVPIDIPATGTPTVTSTLSIPIALNINDVNVINLIGTHTYVDDLKFTLIAPNSTEVLFWNRPCQNHDNFNINFDDEAPGGTWPCPPTNGLTYRPSNSLTSFDGLISDGTWTMEIQDIANNDGGSLNSWGLKVCGTSTCQLIVNQTSGSGPGSLPAALSCAVNGDSIKLSSTLAGQTINIGNSPLQINSNVMIVAQAANITITTSGLRVFEIPNSKTVQFTGMTILAGTSLTGGAVSNSGILTLRDVTITENPLVSNAVLLQNAPGSQLFLRGNCFVSQ